MLPAVPAAVPLGAAHRAAPRAERAAPRPPGDGAAARARERRAAGGDGDARRAEQLAARGGGAGAGGRRAAARGAARGGGGLALWRRDPDSEMEMEPPEKDGDEFKLPELPDFGKLLGGLLGDD